jgi:hypothetical protein
MGSGKTRSVLEWLNVPDVANSFGHAERLLGAGGSSRAIRYSRILLEVMTTEDDALGRRPPISPRGLPGKPAQSFTSSVQTRNDFSLFGPNVVLMATSEASRPRAIKTRPIRGMLLRASKVYH